MSPTDLSSAINEIVYFIALKPLCHQGKETEELMKENEIWKRHWSGEDAPSSYLHSDDVEYFNVAKVSILASLFPNLSCSQISINCE